MRHPHHYVEHLRNKPTHVRQQIALLSAVGIAALVSLGWLAALTTSEAFVLSGNGEALPAPASLAEQGQEFSDLLGAAAAFQATGEMGGLQVIDAEESSTLEQQDPGEATVIPF